MKVNALVDTGSLFLCIPENIAVLYTCQRIITRNLKDYSKSSLPVMTAEQYLASMAS